MSKVKIFFFLLVIIIGCKKINEDCNQDAYPNAPKKEWFKSYGGRYKESHGHFIIACEDGGFLQVGETGNLSESTKICVIKTNITGDLIWKKEFAEGNHNLGNSIIEISDGYVICGSMNKNSCIIKLNKDDGDIMLKETIDNGGTDAFEHIAEFNEGFIAVGYINAQDDLNTFYAEGEGYISYLTSEGEKLNGKNIDNYLSHSYRIKKFENSFFISGLTKNAEDYGLIKLDSSSNIVWNRNFGGAKSDHCFGMDVNSNGDVFLTGHTLSGTKNWDTYTLKIDKEGNKIWGNTSGNPRGFNPKYIHDEAWGVKATIDEGCIIVAGTGDEYRRYKRKCGNSGDNSNQWHVYVIKFDKWGNIEWQQVYSNENQEENWAGEDITLSTNGEIIIAVDNGEFGFLKIEDY